MPTTESNCRALAATRGYELTEQRGRIVIRTRDGQRVHTAGRWSEALRFLLTAPRLDGPSAA